MNPSSFLSHRTKLNAKIRGRKRKYTHNIPWDDCIFSLHGCLMFMAIVGTVNLPYMDHMDFNKIQEGNHESF